MHIHLSCCRLRSGTTFKDTLQYGYGRHGARLSCVERKLGHEASALLRPLSIALLHGRPIAPADRSMRAVMVMRLRLRAERSGRCQRSPKRTRLVRSANAAAVDATAAFTVALRLRQQFQVRCGPPRCWQRERCCAPRISSSSQPLRKSHSASRSRRRAGI